MRPPCYNVEAKTDCIHRSVTCRAGCQAWQEYEIYKKEEYAKNTAERKAHEVDFDEQKRKDTKIIRKRARKLYG